MAVTTDFDPGLPSATPSAPPSQPRLFISTVSPEFLTLRGKIAEIVRHLGYEPVTMDLWSAASGEVRVWLDGQARSGLGLGFCKEITLQVKSPPETDWGSRIF